MSQPPHDEDIAALLNEVAGREQDDGEDSANSAFGVDSQNVRSPPLTDKPLSFRPPRPSQAYPPPPQQTVDSSHPGGQRSVAMGLPPPHGNAPSTVDAWNAEVTEGSGESVSRDDFTLDEHDRTDPHLPPGSAPTQPRSAEPPFTTMRHPVDRAEIPRPFGGRSAQVSRQESEGSISRAEDIRDEFQQTYPDPARTANASQEPLISKNTRLHESTDKTRSGKETANTEETRHHRRRRLTSHRSSAVTTRPDTWSTTARETPGLFKRAAQKFAASEPAQAAAGWFDITKAPTNSRPSSKKTGGKHRD